MHEVLVNRFGGLSLPRKSVVRLTDRPDMTLDVYRGRKTTIQQQQSRSSGLAKTIIQGTVKGKRKKKQTEEEVGRQYQRVDRNGLCQLK